MELNSIVFNTGASTFTISEYGYTAFTLSGAGIVNNSGTTQYFVVGPSDYRDGGYPNSYSFTNDATAGELVQFTVDGGTNYYGLGGEMDFYNSSSAGSIVIITNGGNNQGLYPLINFRDDSSAASATIVATPGDYTNAGVSFYDNSTAGNANITLNGSASLLFGCTATFEDSSNAGDSVLTAFGAPSGGAGHAIVQFLASSSASNAVLNIEGGTEGGSGATLSFGADSGGGTASVNVIDNGSMSIPYHDSPGVTIGSLEGTGLVLLGSNNLTIGSNNRSTTFSGVIQDGGSVTKIGTGNLTLINGNTYTGGTIINGGILLSNNPTGSGSGTGSGPVRVLVGSFGGSGRVTGPVSIGTGSGPGGFLIPGARGLTPGKLTIKKKLTVAADGTYKVTVNSNIPSSDAVIAKGVAIGGAQILFNDLGNSTLPLGTIFTVIKNTAPTSIAGTFANLADGSRVMVGSNTFQANYEGGDGNDLTLTVVP